MAKIVSKKGKKTQEVAAPIKWSVSNMRAWDDGGVTFALNLEVASKRLVTIYGCRIAEGKEGSFINFPSRKGKNGKYYSHAYFRLTQEEQDEIIQAALEGLEEEDVED